MRTITLELLRHGPAHNQLLSPLTPYLALCENHAAVTVHVPFEHNQMLYRLRALSYALGDEPRLFQVQDTARVLGDLLATVPGLPAAMNRRHDQKVDDPVTHLRLILSASELALLPFEMALAPAGCPGAGQPLLLQSQLPLCITRETRRVSEDIGRWPEDLRVLFVTASPPGYEPVPADAHLLALRRALDPWIGGVDEEDPTARHSRVAVHLSVLTNASAESLEAACAARRYTYVHILAHGHEYRHGYDMRFGLALHDAVDPTAVDIVSGERLATALRVVARGSQGELSSPVVVTLASCDSGNIGTVAGAGASIAHALHEAGIPVVIASQFPLSFGASVRMAEILYEGLLWGDDPRQVLTDLRRQLHTQFPQTHDWASLIAYASLPPEFERHLFSLQIRRAQASIIVALPRGVMDQLSLRSGAAAPPPAGERGSTAVLLRIRARVSNAKYRLKALLSRLPPAGARRGASVDDCDLWERARIEALLASVVKREAEIIYVGGLGLSETERRRSRADALELLDQARRHYWEAFAANPGQHFVLLQFLSLTLVLDKSLSRVGTPTALGQAEALWNAARTRSLVDIGSRDAHVRAWAAGNLIELYLLAPLIPALEVATDVAELRTLAARYASELIETTGPESFPVFSTRRQVARYLGWYGVLLRDGATPPARVEDLTEIAKAALEQLPESDEPDWDY